MDWFLLERMWNQDVIKFTRQKSFIYDGVIKSNCKTGTKLYLSKLKIFLKKFISFAFLHHGLWDSENIKYHICNDIWYLLCNTFMKNNLYFQLVWKNYIKSPDFQFIVSFEIHQTQNARYILHKKFLQNIFTTPFWEI